MTKRIDVPGMGVVEFPDEMTDDQIVEAIKRNQPLDTQPPASNPNAIKPGSPQAAAATHSTPVPPKTTVGFGEAALRGAGQGVTLGLQDEAIGAVNSSLLVGEDPERAKRMSLYNSQEPFVANEVISRNPAQYDEDMAWQEKLYRQERDAVRGENDVAKEQQPLAYFGGEVLGGIPTYAATGGAGRVGTAVTGGVQGLGLGESENLGGQMVDVAEGAALSSLAGLAGERLSGMLGRAATKEDAVTFLRELPTVRKQIALKYPSDTAKPFLDELKQAEVEARIKLAEVTGGPWKPGGEPIKDAAYKGAGALIGGASEFFFPGMGFTGALAGSFGGPVLKNVTEAATAGAGRALRTEAGQVVGDVASAASKGPTTEFAELADWLSRPISDDERKSEFIDAEQSGGNGDGRYHNSRPAFGPIKGQF